MRWLGVLVLLVSTTAHAELTKQQVRRTVKANLERVMACVADQKAPPHTVTVTFTIAATGKVVEAVGKGNAAAVNDCMAAAVKKMTFPASDGLTHATFPFNLDYAGS